MTTHDASHEQSLLDIRSLDVGITIAGLSRPGEAFFRSSGVPQTFIPEYAIGASARQARLTLALGSPRFALHPDEGLYEYVYDQAEPHQHTMWMTAPIMERFHQELGRYTIHGSAFAIRDSGVLIVGETNAGKTSTLLAAILERGHPAISGERTLVTDCEIIGGTRHINLFTGLASHQPLLQPLLRGVSVGWNKEHRVRLRLADIGPVKSTATLRVVVFVTTTNDANLERIEWTSMKKALELYKKLSETIRGTNAFLFNNTVGFPSLDTDDRSRDRLAAANRSSTHTIPHPPRQHDCAHGCRRTSSNRRLT